MKTLAVTAAVLFSSVCIGQDTLKLNNLTAAFLDSKGFLYTGNIKGIVTRISESNEDLLYGPSRQAPVTLIDASNPLRIFVFYEDLQEYVILDRFLTETARYSLSDFTTYAGQCAPSQNNLIWVLDLQYFSLRKIDPSGILNEITIPLQQVLDPENYEITFIREYQNLLFLADRDRGLYIFDNFGNLLTHIPEKNINHISFLNDTALILKKPKTLIRYNLYSGTQVTEELIRPAEYYFEGYRKYFITGDSLVIVP